MGWWSVGGGGRSWRHRYIKGRAGGCLGGEARARRWWLERGIGGRRLKGATGAEEVR